MRMRQNPDNTFYVKVNKRLLPKKSATYRVSVTLRDERGAAAFPTMMVVNVKYVDKKDQLKKKAGSLIGGGRGRGP